MRDNRNIALQLLYEFMEKQQYLFLLSLLNLQYADYEYSILSETIKINNQIVNAEFEKNPSSLRYVSIQKARKIRVAYSALSDYANKDNRNGYTYTNKEIEEIKQQILSILCDVDNSFININNDLIAILAVAGTSSSDIEHFIEHLDYEKILSNPVFIKAKQLLIKIMDLISAELLSMWDNARYSREIYSD